MTEEQTQLMSGCTVKWAFAGAVEQIRRANLTGCEPVHCRRCGYWHIVAVAPPRAAT